MSSYLSFPAIFVCLVLAGAISSGAAVPDGGFEKDKTFDHVADLKNGELVFHGAACASCHGAEGDPNLLSGGQRIETKFGVFYAPNISADLNAGIGKWTDAQFLNALLTGKSPNGDQYYGAIFPYPFYSNMKTEDALDLWAYIKTLPQSTAKSKQNEINSINSLILRQWSTAPVPLSEEKQPQLARGQYLVEAVGHCADCHTPRASSFGLSYELDNAHAFEGETNIFGSYAPNITKAHLVAYGPTAFIDGALGASTRLNGTPMEAASMRRISQQTALLSSEDRAAMYAYLAGAPVQVASAAATSVADKEGKASTIPASFCASKASAAAPAIQVQSNPVQSKADAIIEQNCRSCHGAGQTYQKVFFTGDISDIARDAGAVTPGQPEKSLLLQVITDNRMPLGQKMSVEDTDTLSNWIKSLGDITKDTAVTKPESKAEPVQTQFLGPKLDDIYSAALQDVGQASELDRQFYRYFSFAEIPLPHVDCDVQNPVEPARLFEASLNKFLNSVSRSLVLAAVKVVPNSGGSLVRIDLRDYGWTKDDWKALTTAAFTNGATEAGFTEATWHKLAVTYPYAVDPSSDGILSAVSSQTQDKVPVLRSDWFMHFGSESPYYDMLLRLPPRITDLEKRMGVNAEADILDNRVIRAGVSSGSSGVSDHNRMIERHALAGNGYYWKSYDFAGNSERQSILEHPDGPKSLSSTPSHTKPFDHDGGEMIFSLPNGLQGYYLSTAAGDRLSVGPTSIVSFRNKQIGKGVEVHNARSCFDCHENGIISKKDEIRNFIEASTVFSFAERDILFRQYPEQNILDAQYKRDQEKFISSLQELGATQNGADGKPVSMKAPKSVGGGELFTYLADVQFEALNLETVAQQFYLTPDVFRQRVATIGNPVLAVQVSDWISKFDSGLKISREELDAHFSDLLPALTQLRPYSQEPYTPPVNTVTYSQPQITTQTTASAQPPSMPAPSTPVRSQDPLYLELSVPKTDVAVNDLLTFTVSTNRPCELQILYIETNKTIKELPVEVIGTGYLAAGEKRAIPVAGSKLQLRFDEPGLGETMLAFCREGGLGAERLTETTALQYAKDHFQPLERGLIIEAADKTVASNGTSALNAVTFNVRK